MQGEFSTARFHSAHTTALTVYREQEGAASPRAQPRVGFEGRQREALCALAPTAVPGGAGVRGEALYQKRSRALGRAVGTERQNVAVLPPFLPLSLRCSLDWT